jgi:hypothetical protein
VHANVAAAVVQPVVGRAQERGGLISVRNAPQPYGAVYYRPGPRPTRVTRERDYALK